MSDTSMLPPTATDLTKALDLLEERLFSLPVSMITKDPYTVSPGLLDHLAWEHSVDVWDSQWTEEVKRNVIAVSAEVHRFKGTPYAIRTALLAFGVDPDILEWWQPGGAGAGLVPGSFRVTAYATESLYGDNENSINQAMVHAMSEVVRATAPVSRGVIFRLGEWFSTDAYLRTGYRASYRSSETMDPDPRPAVCQAEQGIRHGLRAQLRSEHVHDPAPRPFLVSSNLRVAPGVHVSQRSTIIHDVERRGAA